MSRKVEADVEINDKSSKGLAGFLAGLRKAEDGAKQAQRGVDDVTKSTSKFGKAVDDNAKAFKKLSSELEISKKELGGLAQAFANAGTAAERTDISKAMRKQQSEISKLTKNSNILKDLLPDDHEIKKETQSFGQKLSKNFEGIGELAGPALGIGLAAAAPAIGAAISGAVVGGVGALGVIGGLALAARDPRVEAEAKGFAQRFGSRLTDSVKPFVPVAIDAIHQVEEAADRVNLEGLFSDAAKAAGPLISGTVRGVEELADGIADLIHKAGPEIAAVGDGIEGIGSAIGDGLSELADNGKQSTDALTNFFEVVEYGIRGVFALVDALSKVYGLFRSIAGPGVADAAHALNDVGQKTGTLEKAVHQADGTVTGFTDSMNPATTAVDQFGQKILTSGDAIATFTDNVDALASAGHSLFDSTTQVGEAIDNVTAAAKKNGKTLDENTEKGRNNRGALSSLASALVSNYDAYVQVNGEGVKSNAIAAENRDKFIKLATAFTGSSTKAAALATQMGLIPPKKNTDFTANTHDAAARIKALQEQVNDLHGKSIAIAVSTNVASVKAKVDNTLRRLGGGFDATNHFAFAGAGGGLQRSGGPTPVDAFSAAVTSNLYLDGSLVYSNTARQVKAASKRDAWRQKVGRR